MLLRGNSRNTMACGFYVGRPRLGKKTKTLKTNNRADRKWAEEQFTSCFLSRGEPRLRSNSWQRASKQSKVTWRRARLASTTTTTTTSLTATLATIATLATSTVMLRNHDTTWHRGFCSFFFLFSFFFFWALCSCSLTKIRKKKREKKKEK